MRYAEELDGARFAVTNRDGGVSRGPFAELNLGRHVGDQSDAVDQNRRRVAQRIGLAADRVVYMDQRHGAGVAVVSAPADSPLAVDALVTTSPDLALAVLVADCVPVLLADTERRIVAVAHAGRQGLVAGVVAAAVTAMRELGGRRLTARLGPSICARCYELPAPMRTAVAEVEPAAWATSRRGMPALDVAAGVLAQLARLGVDAVRLPGCTTEDESLYSYRRDRTTGRFAGLAWVAGDGHSS
ncbi:MAG: peptidoglycan editing factor PgeF [Jiangellaceae bacterium]|nr:peptidoglycan editing factor PgeF [Jiangellaceae bacterium]